MLCFIGDNFNFLLPWCKVCAVKNHFLLTFCTYCISKLFCEAMYLIFAPLKITWPPLRRYKGACSGRRTFSVGFEHTRKRLQERVYKLDPSYVRLEIAWKCRRNAG
jgi:hypothetical protein